ncbi:MAG: TLD domain-containing protein [Deltaproteobacteria bacterium]|nr:TLD domain-containing protein [Deltaproteobacteria bacterium]
MLRTTLCSMALTMALFGAGCGSTTEPAAQGDATSNDDADADPGADGAVDGASDATGGDTADGSTAKDTADDGASDVATDAAPDTPIGGAFGAPCSSNAECASAICLPIGRCSKTCVGAGDCPASWNWSCVSLPGRSPACSCTVLGSEDVACNGTDENCNGVIDEGTVTCGTTCADIKRDPNNCGACGVVCGGGTICQSGSCVCPSGKPTICGASCVDLASDPLNCGKCGAPCPGGASGTSVCTAGTCSLECSAGFGNCNGSVTDGCEKDLRSDNANCGVCGRACSFANASASCNTGSCVISSCSTGFGNCDFDPANGCETNTATSTANCGGCGKACAPANGIGTCVSGACELLACTAGWSDCNGNKADGCEIKTSADLNNCGACGKVCDAGKFCSAGTCCTAGQLACGGVCVDTNRDPGHCGGCGTTCSGTTPYCRGGACVTSCGTGMTACGYTCVDTSKDPKNCGACGNACPSTEVCFGGTCVQGGFPGSAIIDVAAGAKINAWIGTPAQIWTRCYSKIANGASASTFHSLCDGKGATVSVARLNSSGTIRVMGGYNTSSWSTVSGYGGSTANFLFSLTNDFKHTYPGSYTGAYYSRNYSTYGPTFGGGYDWQVNSTISGGYCNLGYTYQCRTGAYGSLTCQADLCGSYSSWTIEDLEVWYQ